MEIGGGSQIKIHQFVRWPLQLWIGHLQQGGNPDHPLRAISWRGEEKKQEKKKAIENL